MYSANNQRKVSKLFELWHTAWRSSARFQRSLQNVREVFWLWGRKVESRKLSFISSTSPIRCFCNFFFNYKFPIHFSTNPKTVFLDPREIIIINFHLFSLVRIPVVLREPFYCQAIKEGGDREWEFLIGFYNREHWEYSNEIILSALSCTTDSDKLRK